MSEVFLVQDLETMTEQQRQQYVKNLCHKLGIPDDLNLVALTYLDDQNGPSRLVPYIKRGGAEAIRANFGVNVTSLTNQMLNGSIMFTATGVDKNHRQEVAIGAKFIDGLTGTELDDAVMVASTRALRRLSLQFTGTGILDESEISQRKTIHTVSAPITPTPQPTVQPSNGPGKDITIEKVSENPQTQAQVTAIVETKNLEDKLKSGTPVSEAIAEVIQEQKRSEVIAELNAQIDTPVKKTRKPRGPNKKKAIDLGPSEIPAAAPLPAPPAEKPEAVITSAPVAPSPSAPQAAVIAAPVATLTAPPSVRSKPKLNQDQIKPFRQRLFRLVNDYLEPNGFAPKENMGNAAKMRFLAQLMFTDIVDMNDLSVEQWEKYLSLLEQKVQNDGPAATIKYIEDAIEL